jgi:ribulose-phosphate 3-epimerase
MDGGINLNNLKEVLLSGVDTIVAGTAVFGGDITENIKAFKKIM